MAETYDTISDVRRGAEVNLPVLEAHDNFLLLKMDGEDGVSVTLFGLTIPEAIDALMGAMMALNG